MQEHILTHCFPVGLQLVVPDTPMYIQRTWEGWLQEQACCYSCSDTGGVAYVLDGITDVIQWKAFNCLHKELRSLGDSSPLRQLAARQALSSRTTEM